MKALKRRDGILDAFLTENSDNLNILESHAAYRPHCFLLYNRDAKKFQVLSDFCRNFGILMCLQEPLCHKL